jgi:hypothetical protein
VACRFEIRIEPQDLVELRDRGVVPAIPGEQLSPKVVQTGID